MHTHIQARMHTLLHTYVSTYTQDAGVYLYEDQPCFQVLGIVKPACKIVKQPAGPPVNR